MTRTWPEPAATLYRTTRKVILGPIHEAADDGWGVKIGGGTVLALRWTHRASEDLDLVVSTLPTKAWWKRVTNAMMHAGCEQQKTGDDGLSPRAVPTVMAFLFTKGKIDISTNVLALPAGHAAGDVQGDQLTLLSNAQILAGKYWGRSGTAPSRDLYDLAVAAELDPAALQIAINGYPRGHAEAAMKNWWDRREEYPKDTYEITKPDARWSGAATEPARHAIAAVMDSLHDNISIRVEKGVTVVETSRERTTDRIRMADPAEVTRWWSETAQSQLWRTVDPADANGRPQLEAILKAMGRKESETIADWTPDPVKPPAGWTRPDKAGTRSLGRNLPPTPGSGNDGEEPPPPPQGAGAGGEDDELDPVRGEGEPPGGFRPDERETARSRNDQSR